MYSKINQIRNMLERLYESQGISDEVLKLSKELDKEINKIQKEILSRTTTLNIK